MRNSSRLLAAAVVSALAMASATRADVFNLPAGETSLQFVTVGGPGNAPDANGLGSVSYAFQMGTYDITSSQYAAFLNSVASTDPHGLYDLNMLPGGAGSPGITRSGALGSYTYGVATGYANFPVSEVSWGDAARFCNWLANGQPATGGESATTTETGSYSLNGAVTDQQLELVARSATAKYVIPNENEWYKAAYYKGGSANAGYWLFATQSNTPPSNVLSMTGTNNANFFDPINGFTDTSLGGLTAVGTFAESYSAYGTFDQAGDIDQLMENFTDGQVHARGGSFEDSFSGLESDSFDSLSPSAYEALVGFRIAEVPEPSSIGLLALGSVFLLRRRGK